MSFGQRFLLTLAITLGLLFALAFCGYWADRWGPYDADAQPRVDLYQGISLDEHLLALDKRALDEAYHAHTVRLWNVLLSDGGRFVDNFRKGMKISREMYHQASEQIAKREEQIKQQK